jgi:hypothetical protein
MTLAFFRENVRGLHARIAMNNRQLLCIGAFLSSLAYLRALNGPDVDTAALVMILLVGEPLGGTIVAQVLTRFTKT